MVTHDPRYAEHAKREIHLGRIPDFPEQASSPPLRRANETGCSASIRGGTRGHERLRRSRLGGQSFRSLSRG